MFIFPTSPLRESAADGVFACALATNLLFGLGKLMIVLPCQAGEPLWLELSSLVGASFEGMNLHRIIFDGRILHECNFSKSSLRNAGFVGADLSNAKLQGALLMNAYLMRAMLKDCNFEDAVLVGADFTCADLTGANLSNSDVRFCSFKGATLKGADLGVINAESADWSGAIYDERTVWPTGFDPAGAELVRDAER